MHRTDQTLNIAIVGTGIAGMSAAWLLNGKHRVTVYEKASRLGGHSHTVDVPHEGGSTAVDTGFIVYNAPNYPNLSALFNHLDVRTKASDMSFAASLRGGGMEYAGTDLDGLLGQRSNIFRPRFWRMVKDIVRFYGTAATFLSQPDDQNLSLGSYLAREGYSEQFIDDHLLPMGAAIWSTNPPELLAYPAKSFISFFKSHGLLLLRDRPQWRTVEGGSREYVAKLTAPYADNIRYSGVRAIRRAPAGVTIEDQKGHIDHFDHVVVATHADEALCLLSDADSLETDLLGKWRYARNTAILHGDPALMPRRQRVWASWNFIDSGKNQAADLCVTYWMNRLQGLAHPTPLFVTLNPVRPPSERLVYHRTEYTHPQFDVDALWSQQRLWQLQGRRNTWFCGSYFGFGFHEDALQAGLAVAEQLGGVRRPWTVSGENSRIHVTSASLEAAA
jgi:predicted NAD/FAD-binding protein